VNQHSPHVVAHGPLAYQGLNLPNLHTEQLISHVTTLLKYGSQHGNLASIFLCMSCNLLCLEAGVSSLLFQISLCRFLLLPVYPMQYQHFNGYQELPPSAPPGCYLNGDISMGWLLGYQTVHTKLLSNGTGLAIDKQF